VSGLDLSTAAGALRFCELRRAEMVACWHRLGRFEVNGFSFCGWAFNTHEILTASKMSDWRTGKRLPATTATLMRMPAEVVDLVHPSRLTQFYAAFARLGKAVGTVIMTEMWHVRTNDPEGVGSRAKRDELPDNLEDAPGRSEALMLMLEHQETGARSWTAEITREPDSLHDWCEITGWKKTEGRLVGLVPRREAKGSA
jgi:hypothetical protein